jgi:hypothetical protein
VENATLNLMCFALLSCINNTMQRFSATQRRGNYTTNMAWRVSNKKEEERLAERTCSVCFLEVEVDVDVAQVARVLA